ncbi:MAG: hypothetical protein EZS28_022423, partial [Streblomastix strix]
MFLSNFRKKYQFERNFNLKFHKPFLALFDRTAISDTFDYLQNPSAYVGYLTILRGSIESKQDFDQHSPGSIILQVNLNVQLSGAQTEEPIHILVEGDSQYKDECLDYIGDPTILDFECSIMQKPGIHWFMLVKISSNLQDIESRLKELQKQTEQALNTSWKLSDFEKIKKIGQGGFGTVWLMKEKETTLYVAVKEMNYCKDNEIEHVHREIDMMQNAYEIARKSSSSSFINVVEPLGFFVDKDKEKAYLVMEYCEGGDLRCMENFESNCVCCKPASFKQYNTWKFKARKNITHERLQNEVGLYFAPEIHFAGIQQLRKKQIFAADIWALGITLFELLAQYHPFTHDE